MAENVINEEVYLGRDNTIDLELRANDSAVVLTSVTRIDLIEMSGAFSVSSVSSPAAFDWVTGAASGILSLALGGQAIPPGTHRCKLLVFDPTNTDGVVWKGLQITVVKADT